MVIRERKEDGMKPTRMVCAALVALGMVLSGCGAKEPAEARSTAASSLPSNDSGWTVYEPLNQSAAVELIDEAAYEGDELKVIQAVNKRVTYYNERNTESYKTLFTSDTVSGTDLGADPENKTIITKLSEPTFLVVKDDSITLTVHETYQDSPYGPVGDTLYTLQLEDGEWKIYGID
ncbi:hypothetical protein FHS18_004708 [Paenibacillus phyllosphaerae]|uniref:Uncharacterized protein n=1 Tax=Paenibacillus phyllosphaerae TaxID=274593 RepID=A0A7W5B1N0_9BACL|nr:hypothetical protein [Paenibacillus phyllosphaerae]MBB3112607.1 hypothetical protein [Paenibacillus phyllosphaerae]